MESQFFLRLLINTPLFIYGLKKQGITFTVYAIYTVFIDSLGAWLITDILPIDVTFASPLGSGLAIRYGGVQWTVLKLWL